MEAPAESPAPAFAPTARKSRMVRAGPGRLLSGAPSWDPLLPSSPSLAGPYLPPLAFPPGVRAMALGRHPLSRSRGRRGRSGLLPAALSLWGPARPWPLAGTAQTSLRGWLGAVAGNCPSWAAAFTRQRTPSFTPARCSSRSLPALVMAAGPPPSRGRTPPAGDGLGSQSAAAATGERRRRRPGLAGSRAPGVVRVAGCKNVATPAGSRVA